MALHFELGTGMQRSGRQDLNLQMNFNFFAKVPSYGGEPGIFQISVYFLSQLQHLGPLGYCAPLTSKEKINMEKEVTFISE